MGKSGKTYREGARAAYWVAKLRAGALSESDRRRFEAWRAAHPNHHAAVDPLLRVQREERGRLSRARKYSARRRDGRTRPQSAASLERRLGDYLPRILFVALAVLLAAVFLSREQAADYRTAPGAQASFALTDGSVVFMNTDTALDVFEEGERRRMDLLRGEADFTVLPGGGPMEIAVAAAVVSLAEGRLLLRKDWSGITLSVIDGVAQLKSRAGGSPAVEIGTGDTVMLSEDGTAVVPSETTIASIAAWQEGAVVFEATPLDEALRQVGRYRSGRLAILGSRLAAHAVQGRYSLKDPDALMARLLEEGGGGKLEFFGLLTLVY
ncbi:MAG: FecR domain-containing protein [Rhodovibrionaceae bacterium]